MAPFKKGPSQTTNTTQSNSNHAAISNQPPPSPSEQALSPNDDFSARRSSRVAAGRYVADNDTWVEALAVCEMPMDPKKGNVTAKGSGGILKRLKSKSSSNLHGNVDSNNTQEEAELAMASQRLTLRPYFQSQNTSQRVWDEPPSGASTIIYASVEARKMAEAQLEEMRATYAHAALIRNAEREEEKKVFKKSGGVDTAKGGGGKKMGLPKLFKRPDSRNAAENNQSSAPLVASSSSSSGNNSNIGHNHESSRRSFATNRTGGIPPSVLQESVDLASERNYESDLQMAMLMSMDIGGGSVMGVGQTDAGNNFTAKAAARREKEELAIATALSLSETNHNQQRKKNEKKRKGSSSRQSSTSSYDKEPLIQPSSSTHPTKMPPPPTMTQINADFEVNYFGDDGRGKMSAATTSMSNNDFGDKGSEWELEWGHEEKTSASSDSFANK